jgi:hypothetical protein
MTGSIVYRGAIGEYLPLLDLCRKLHLGKQTSFGFRDVRLYVGTRPIMKRILFAVCGLTPQVITETLYALLQQGRVPDAIRILTTREGKNAITAALLNPVDGAYYRFIRDKGEFRFDRLFPLPCRLRDR